MVDISMHFHATGIGRGRNAIGKGAALDIHNPTFSMPKLIPGGVTVQLMGISSEGITGGELVRPY